MLLSELSHDALELIILKIDGRSVSMLRECGNALLAAKMSQTVKDVRLQTLPFMKFPHSLFCWPNIRSVRLQSNEFMSYYPIALNGAYPLPLTPVPTLEKLELSFAQSFSVLTLVDGQPLLDSIFPLLKCIILTNSTKILTEDHMKAIPRNLEKLSLSTMYTSASRYWLPCTVLEDLPPKLNKVSIYSSHIKPNEETGSYESIKWPVALRYMRLRLASFQFLLHLPQTLEYLSLDVADARNLPSTWQIPFVSTSILPKGLTTCRIDGFRYKTLEGFKSETYPPNLEVLSTQLQVQSFVEELALLPKSLTEVRLPRATLDYVNIAELLPNLRALSGTGPYPKSYLENLPPKLRDFHYQDSNCGTLADIPSLPSSLESLGIKTPAESSEMMKMPRGLKNLYLETCSPLSSDLVELLPPSLDSITFDLHNFKDLNALAKLPKSIRSLELSTKRDAPTLLSQDPSLFEILSTLNLTAILINIGSTGTVWFNWIESMKRFESLDMLFIYVDDRILSSEDWDMAYLKYIPPTIRDLYVPFGRTPLLPNHMKNLPRCLRTLHFSSTYSGTPTASDECFMNLPQSLTSFTLPTKLEGLTENIINIIPPTLLELCLPDTSLHRVYFERPHWEGYSYFANKPQYY